MRVSGRSGLRHPGCRQRPGWPGDPAPARQGYRGRHRGPQHAGSLGLRRHRGDDGPLAGTARDRPFGGGRGRGRLARHAAGGLGFYRQTGAQPGYRRPRPHPDHGTGQTAPGEPGLSRQSGTARTPAHRGARTVPTPDHAAPKPRRRIQGQRDRPPRRPGRRDQRPARRRHGPYAEAVRNAAGMRAAARYRQDRHSRRGPAQARRP